MTDDPERDGFAQTVPEPAGAGARPAIGARCGRFLVERALGEGGMGVVLLATDPELGRKVALKLLRPEVAGEEGHARLVREAQAMARLAHPNVVTVFEVGRAGEQVFIAMELVDGQTLRAWLRAAQRPWREIVAMFAGAARGLIAAHDAGLVHRDFKPENVLVGTDGRPRVTDFGLVAEGVAPRADAAGTPGYMSAEQWAGQAIDARSDQFSFCVALWEALHGARPFAGATAADVRAAVLAGERSPPPRGDVPAWLSAALARGLARDPAQRWPSLAALVGELTRRRGSRWRWWAAAGAAVAASAAIAVVATLPRAVDPCARAGDGVARTWSPERAAALRRSLETAGKPYAASVAGRVVAELDRYTGAWRAAAIETCTATHVHHQQSLDLLDRRGACLEARRREVDALVTALTAPIDGPALESATRAVYTLGSLDACADRDQLLAAVPPPPPAARAAGDALAARLEDARAQHRLGRYELTRARLEPIVTEAVAAGYPPLIADALHLQGMVRRDLGDLAGAVATFHRAAAEAARARRDELVARVYLDLFEVVVDRQQQLDVADALLPLVEAAVTRAGDRPAQRASYELVRGLAFGHRSKFEQERAHLAEAVRLYEQALGPRSVELAAALSRLASSATELRRFEDARAENERSAEIIRALFGDDHPRMAVILGNLGWNAAEANQLEAAIEYTERALAINEATLGDHTNTANNLGNLANFRAMQERYAEAVPLYRRTLDVLARTVGKDHPAYGRNIGNLGLTLSQLGRHDEGRLALTESLELKRAAFGEQHASTAYALEHLSSLELDAGRHEDALAYARRALAARRATLGDDHQMTGLTWKAVATIQAAAGRCGEAIDGFIRATAIVGKAVGAGSADLVQPLTSHAECLQRLGRTREALPLAERALEIALATEVEPRFRAGARFLVGSLRWAAGIGSRDAQRALVREAAAELRTSGPAGAERLREALAWLASHR